MRWRVCEQPFMNCSLGSCDRKLHRCRTTLQLIERRETWWCSSRHMMFLCLSTCSGWRFGSAGLGSLTVLWRCFPWGDTHTFNHKHTLTNTHIHHFHRGSFCKIPFLSRHFYCVSLISRLESLQTSSPTVQTLSSTWENRRVNKKHW